MKTAIKGGKGSGKGSPIITGKTIRAAYAAGEREPLLYISQHFKGNGTFGESDNKMGWTIPMTTKNFKK